MVKRKIVWTHKAQEERKEILDYWISRNQSNTYSIKLNSLIIETLQITAHYPNSGRKTNNENIRVKIIHNYLLFYEINKTTLVVLALWDSRRSEETLNLK